MSSGIFDLRAFMLPANFLRMLYDIYLFGCSVAALLIYTAKESCVLLLTLVAIHWTVYPRVSIHEESC